MNQAKVYAVAQQKGGTGKTTTAISVAAGFAKEGKRALLVDLDAQRNLSYSTGTIDTEGATAGDLIEGTAPAAAAIRHTGGGFDVIPAADTLGVLPITGDQWRRRLSDALAPIRGDYDVIVLDTPPTLGQVLAVALTAAEAVIVPTAADYYSLQGVNQICQTVEAARAINKRLRIDGILITRYNPRKVISRDTAKLIEETAKRYGTRVYAAKIRQCCAIEEAAAMRTDIFTYAPNSTGAKDYNQFLQELK